jgi:hypothetical protein
MRHAMRTGVVVGALALAGCNAGLSQPWQLTDFRVLGIKSDPPEVPRGGDTSVSLAYADTVSRPLQVLWLACRTPISLTSGLDGGTGGLTGGFGGSAGCSLVTMPGSRQAPAQGNQDHVGERAWRKRGGAAAQRGQRDGLSPIALIK